MKEKREGLYMKKYFYFVATLFLSNFSLHAIEQKEHTMNIVCITHADFETPGIIEDWAKKNNYQFSICRPYKGDKCPAATKLDFLVVMGGPQDAWDTQKFPYLADEIALIKQAIAETKIVAGFCLGAQLIGEALEARTGKSPEKEIGVFPITLTTEGKKEFLFEGFPSTFPVIHWHNDMPGLAADSVLLASSEGCPRQIIRYAPKAYGFQCHLEIPKEGMEKMIEECPNDLKPSRFTQTTEQLREQDYETINGYMVQILNKLVELR